MAVKILVILILSLNLPNVSKAYSYQDVLNFFEKTFSPQCTTCYTDQIFPRTTQSEQIVVDINFTLLSIGEFNEGDGVIDVNGLMDIGWDDYLIAAFASSVKDLPMPRDDVWVPTITIFNAHSNMSMIGDASTDVRITMPTTTYGEMKWSPSITSKTNCPVDSTYFPFDTQKCNITLTPWGYTDSEVNISVTNMSLDTSLFREHEMWSLITYQSNTENIDNQSFVFYELTLQRKPKYFLLIYYLPFLFLVFLSNLVFLVPSDSGERVGYSILIFLSIAIFMAMVTGNLPKSSTQMSILSFYFTTMIVVDGIITYLAILSLTIHSKDTASVVPLMIVNFIACCGCYEEKHRNDLSNRKSRVTPLTISEYDDNDDGYFSHPKFHSSIEEDFRPATVRRDNKNYNNDYDITWKHVARTFDKICLLFFVLINFLLTMIFFTPMLVHYYA